jgi:hypothetical protein
VPALTYESAISAVDPFAPRLFDCGAPIMAGFEPQAAFTF